MISLNTQLRKRAWLARSFTLSPACHAKAVRHERRRVAPELSTPPKRLRRLDQRRRNHQLLNPVGAPTSGRGIAQNRDRELAIRNRAQSQCRVESVRHKIAPRICPAAEIDKNFPMTRSGREKMHRFSGTKILDKFQRQRQRQRARLLENLRMRDNAQAPAQGQFRDRHSSRLPQRRFEP